MTYKPEIVIAYYLGQGLPRPDFEWVFCNTRKFRFDIAWPDPRIKLAIEVQGGVWSRGAHGRGAGIVRDYEKHNLAVTMGWRILYVLPREVCMLETVQLVKRCMGIEA